MPYLHIMEATSIIAEKDAQIAMLKSLVLEQTQKIYDLTHELGKLQRIVYGRKAERYIPEPGPSLFADLEAFNKPPVVEPAEETEVIRYERKKPSKHKGRSLLENCSHLPVEDVLLDVEDKLGMVKIGELVSEKLAYKPGRLYRKRFIRPKYKHAESEQIVIADPVNEPIAKCEADISLLVFIIISKFVDHLPEHRLRQILKREGITIPASTMNSWTHQTAKLLTIVASVMQQSILNSKYVQIDESTIRVMSGKKNGTHTGYMWVLRCPQTNQVCFIYHKGRDKGVVTRLFKNFEGIVQTDGYASYDHLELLNNDIVHVNCWAHARRKFEEALTYDKDKADHALGVIKEMYMVERRCRNLDMSPEQRQQERALLSKKIKEFKKWLEEESLTALPKTVLGKAVGYTLSRWKNLTRYLDNGLVEIDNNLIENAIRPLALGRKNYLFAGSHEAAANIAVFYTIFGTCKQLDVNPYEYMEWLLSRISNTSIQQIHTITPEAYKNSLAKLEV